jgi:uncharacterized membrane protein (DUF2068 family)
MVIAPERPLATEPTHARESEEREPMTVGLWLIIALKAVTALLLCGAFVVLLLARQSNPQDFFSVLVHRMFRGNPPGIAIRYIATNTEFITRAMLTRVALATFAYAAVEATEAVGLFLRKAWAEWLVILVTVSFIPVEIYEIVSRPNPIKVLTLIANVLILWYLLKRLLEKRSKHKKAQPSLAPSA